MVLTPCHSFDLTGSPENVVIIWRDKFETSHAKTAKIEMSNHAAHNNEHNLHSSWVLVFCCSKSCWYHSNYASYIWEPSSWSKVFVWCCPSVGKRNYFTHYRILLQELPVVVVLITQSNNNEGTMKNSILHEIFCKSLFRTSRPIVK